MVKAVNDTCVKKIRQDGVNDYFQAFSFQSGHISYYTYPQSMEMTDMEVANCEFPELTFEIISELEFPN